MMIGKPDAKRMVITVELEDDEATFTEHDIPARWAVCPRCEGRGIHDHEAFSDGFSGAEEWCDPEFQEDYHRGAFDVQCSECSGRTTILEPDPDRTDADVLKRYYDECAADASYRAEAEAERRMGA